MTCKKSELISAVNSFGFARATGDGNLIDFSVNLLTQLIETLEFAPEESPVVKTENTEEILED